MVVLISLGYQNREEWTSGCAHALTLVRSNWLADLAVSTARTGRTVRLITNQEARPNRGTPAPQPLSGGGSAGSLREGARILLLAGSFELD